MVVGAPGCTAPRPDPWPTAPALDGWQYRWSAAPCPRVGEGASPSAGDLPGEWLPYAGRGAPPGPAGPSLWLRATVPPEARDEPHALLYPLGIVGHVSLDGHTLSLPPAAAGDRPVGILDESTPAALLLALPRAAARWDLRVCVSPDHTPGLGFDRAAHFGPALALVRAVVLEDLPYLAFWAFLFVLGLAFVALAAGRPRAGRGSILTLGLFFTLSGFWQLFSVPAMRINALQAVRLDEARSIAFCFAPTFLSAFLALVLAPRWRRALRLAAGALGVYAAGLAILTLSGLSVRDLPALFRGFHIAMLAGLAFNLYVLVRSAAAGDDRARALLPGMVVASAVGMVDLAARGMRLFHLALDLSPVAWLALILSFLVVLERHMSALARQKDEYARQLAAARDRAELASVAKSEFLATLSHEVRTPMNTVLGLTQLLLDTDLQAQQREFAALSADACRTLLATLDEVLDFSRLEAGRVELQQSVFDLRALLDGLARPTELLATRKGLGLRYETSLSDPHPVLGDRLRLRQVLSNLLDNAVKFTERGHIRLAASAPASADPSALYAFHVSDTGQGISPQKRRALFESFVRGTGAAARQGGSGLGLPIAKGLVELMGGRLEVETWDGEGTAFSVYVPLGPVPPGTGQLAPAEEPAADPLPAAELSVRATSASDSGGRVLVAEDDPMSQRLMDHLFQRLGVEYDLAPGGQAALDLLRARRYAVVLMDCFLPGLDGLEATRRLRRGEAGDANVPVVALTAATGQDQRARCADAGMDVFLSKPLELKELEQVLRRYGVLGEVSASESTPSACAPAAGGCLRPDGSNAGADAP